MLPETKQKISKSLIGVGKGVPKSPEHKEKIAQSSKVKIFSDEHRENLSTAGKKRKHSEATKQKMSASRKQYYDEQRILDSWPH